MAQLRIGEGVLIRNRVPRKARRAFTAEETVRAIWRNFDEQFGLGAAAHFSETYGNKGSADAGKLFDRDEAWAKAAYRELQRRGAKVKNGKRAGDVSPDLVAAMRRAVREESTATAVMARLGLAYANGVEIAREHGIILPDGRERSRLLLRKEVPREDLEQVLKSTPTLARVAERFGMAVGTLVRRIKEHDLTHLVARRPGRHLPVQLPPRVAPKGIYPYPRR